MEETTLLNSKESQVDEVEQQLNDGIEIQDTEIFGNIMEKKMENELRIIYVNINGLPRYTSHPKNRMVYDAITNCEGGVIALTEINKY